MNIQRATPVNEFLAKLIFLILPTAAVGYFLLDKLNVYYSILQNEALQQTLFFAAGMAASALFYSFRFRFVPTFVLLIFAAFSIYKGIDRYSTGGEFDTFFISMQFRVAAILFCTGWLMGWGFLRMRYWSVFVAVALLSGSIMAIAKSKIDSVEVLLTAFSPAILYAVYIIFTAEQIYNYKDKSQKFWWFLSRRLALFTALAALIFGSVVYMMRKDIEDTVANYGGGGKASNSMLKKNKDNKFDLEQYSRLSGSLGRSNELLFCAHINNFFPNTDIPNPLYLTAFYFTKFDTISETFERDKTIPFNDLFQPDPTKLPIFSTRTDSTVIYNSLGDKMRNIVDVEVYSKELSPYTYLAPNAGFFVQPITIEKDFRQEFKSAFRAKSYVSALNSAYFIYNSPDPQLRKFQEMRFEVLRKVTDYSEVDDAFMKYYTDMPTSPKFSAITKLAHSITDTAHTPVDKVLAIRNYFLSKDENGERLYRYTDNPGIPDLPNASKLMYFLTENHKGYCAYFAGATLFMLRSMGIPSRIAVGFLTEERSDKNKGWYWYYANQAHAWVQVYFPGYGWLDFDTTVGNDNENRPTPQPDGTPPMQPPKAWLAADGIVENVDTLKKTMEVKVKQFMFHDKDYKLARPHSIIMDMSVGVVYKDSMAIPLKDVVKGDEGTSVSYAEALSKPEPAANADAEALLKSLVSPTPIDEVYLRRRDVAHTEKEKPKEVAAKPMSTERMLWILAGIVAGLLLAALGTPRLVFAYYKLRYRNAGPSGDKPYWAYRAATYYLHMCGIYRGSRTPMQYARDIVDPQLGTSLTAFMNIYLKTKYAKQPLTQAEQQAVGQFLGTFLTQAGKQIKFSKRFLGFMNPVRAVAFFTMPGDDDA